MKWFVRWWLNRQEWDNDKIKFFKERDLAVAPMHVWVSDMQKDALTYRQQGIMAGKDIGKLEVLRYTIEIPQCQDARDTFNFNELDTKYPGDPLCRTTKL